MGKFTPGPWTVFTDNREADGQWYVSGYNIEADGAEVVGSEGICCGPADEANARLIACAPDLLEALREVMASAEDIRGIDVELYCPAAWAKARAVIAKATGDSA